MVSQPMSRTASLIRALSHGRWCNWGRLGRGGSHSFSVGQWDDAWLMTHLSHETYTVPTRPQPVPPLIAYL